MFWQLPSQNKINALIIKGKNGVCIYSYRSEGDPFLKTLFTQNTVMINNPNNLPAPVSWEVVII